MHRGFAAKTPARVLAVTSGKGGVGKSNIVLNLAIALAEKGQRVIILDADLGLGNLDILLGIRPLYTWSDVMGGRCRLREALVEGPAGIRILAADSGVDELASLNAPEMIRVFSLFRELQEEAGTVLIDTASGIASNVQYFSSFAHTILLVATPEPTSLTDAYATMKVLSQRNGEEHFQLAVNLVESEKQGLHVYRTLERAADAFLKVRLEYAGCILKDPNMARAVSMQQPLMVLDPDSRACGNLRALAFHLNTLGPADDLENREPDTDPMPGVALCQRVTVH
jgi:flagellar biosynthesis protein FlhG